MVLDEQDLNWKGLSVSSTSLSGGGGLKGISLLRFGRSGSKASRLPLLVELLLLVLLAWLLMKLLFALITPVEQGAAVPATPAAGGSGPAFAGDYSVLTTYDAFAGRPVGETVREAVVMEDVAETSLDITLVGVWANRDGSGSALVQMGSRQAEPYRTGEEIQSGITLRQVGPDRIIISRNGVNESVYLEGIDRGDRSGNSGRASSSQAAPQSSEVEGRLTLAKVADVMGMRPVRDPTSNRITSYEIFPRDEGKFFSLGFVEGDVIKLVNNRRAPGDPEDLKELLEELSGSSRVRFVVSRGGEAVEVVITPSELY